MVSPEFIPIKDETAGGRGGDGDGLPGWAANGHLPPGSTCIMACKRPDASWLDPEKCLRNPGIVINSSGKLTTVVGPRPSGKSRTKGSGMFESRPSVICSQCGRPLKYMGASFGEAELWRGTTCMKCRIILCDRCREPVSGPCPRCGQPMDPADSACLWGRGYEQEIPSSGVTGRVSPAGERPVANTSPPRTRPTPVPADWAEEGLPGLRAAMEEFLGDVSGSPEARTPATEWRPELATQETARHAADPTPDNCDSRVSLGRTIQETGNRMALEAIDISTRQWHSVTPLGLVVCLEPGRVVSATQLSALGKSVLDAIPELTGFALTNFGPLTLRCVSKDGFLRILDERLKAQPASAYVLEGAVFSAADGPGRSEFIAHIALLTSVCPDCKPALVTFGAASPTAIRHGMAALLRPAPATTMGCEALHTEPQSPRDQTHGNLRNASEACLVRRLTLWWRTRILFWATKHGQWQSTLARLARLTETEPELTNARDKDGNTPLHHAVLRGNSFFFDCFTITPGVTDVNARNNDGYTPLHVAVTTGVPSVARVLLEHGADVNARTSRGATPLHIVPSTMVTQSLLKERGLVPPITYHATEMAKLLLEFGANVNARDQAGLTPLQRAREAPGLVGRLIRFLVEHGGA